MAEGVPINKQSIFENAVFAPGATVKIDSIEQKQVIYQAPVPKRPGEPFEHNIPRSGVGAFVGRSEDMAKLHKALQEARQGSIVALKGMGGVGKTELAIRYAHQYLNPEYPAGVCWVTGSVGDIGDQLIQFAVTRLGLTVPKEELPDPKAQVDFCWHNWPLSGQALVIVDDLHKYADLKPYLPPEDSRFKILITTRKSFGKPVQNVELDVLEAESALELLGSVIGAERQEKELDSAKRLCGDILGYLPLGIELVGRYLERNKTLLLEKMCERLEKKKLEHEALKKPDEEPTTAELGVAAAFELSWIGLSSAAQNLGTLLSLFALSPIPWGLVEAIQAELIPEDDAGDLEEVLREAQEELHSLHLVREPFEGRYLLHTLIREYFAHKREQFAGVEELKRGYCRVMVSQAQEFPYPPTRMQWEEFAPVVPHLAEIASKLLAWVDNDGILPLFCSLGRFFDAQGAFIQAKIWYESCITVCCDRFGEENENTATAINNLGSNLESLGHYNEALQYYEKTLIIRRRILGDYDIMVANILNNIALLQSHIDELDAAELNFRLSLAIIQETPNAPIGWLITTQNNLALVLDSQGKHKDAEVFLTDSLNEAIQIYGLENIFTARAFNNLAKCLVMQSRFEEAEDLYFSALRICLNEWGEEHQETAGFKINIANLFCRMERYKEAEAYFSDAIPIIIRFLGSEHPDVSNALSNYIGLLRHIIQNQPGLGEDLLSSGSHMTQVLLREMLA
jgi:tetratricopeptide (TPR) repeat protein